MSRRKKNPAALDELRMAARSLSRMLADAVEQAERERAAEPSAADNRELKELTAVLKDVVGVVKTLEPEQTDQYRCGVVILPEVELHEEA